MGLALLARVMCVSAFRGGRPEKTGGGYAASQYGSTGQSERPTSAARLRSGT